MPVPLIHPAISRGVTRVPGGRPQKGSAPLNTTESPLRDQLHRPLHDLRISVIDRCNFRCTYCMPEKDFKHYQFLNPGQWLEFHEITRFTRLFVKLGVKKIRLTGGEPLIRPDLPELVKALTAIESIEDLALTTNGSLLARHASHLKKAGLKRLTISLDTLDEKVLKTMSGRKAELSEVLAGIEEAERVGFRNMKINVVIKRGVNDHTLMDLIRRFKGSGHILRFIEFMDVGNCNHWSTEFVLPSKEIVKIINEEYPIEPVKANYFGEVAERYCYKDGSGEIGFISSVTQPFCGTCNRARLSTDGKFFTCLFASQGTDLRGALRSGASDEDLQKIITNTWQKREDRYSELRSYYQSLPEKIKKVEMFQMGG